MTTTMTTEIATLDERELTLFSSLEEIVNLPTGSIRMLGLELPDEPIPYEEFVQIGRALGAARKWTIWALGDWINKAEEYGEEYEAQAVDATREDRYDVAVAISGLAPGTLHNYASLAKRVKREQRRAELDPSTHGPVAALDVAEQIEWLQKAVDNAWGKDDLAQALRDSKNPPAEGDEQVEVLEPRLSIRDRLEAAGRNLLRLAQTTSDGSFLVPAEPMAQLREALGEE